MARKKLCPPTTVEANAFRKTINEGFLEKAPVKQMDRWDPNWSWSVVKRMVAQSMGGEWNYNSIPNAKQQKVLKKIIADNLKWLTNPKGKDAGWFERNLWLRQEVFSGTALNNTLTNFQTISENFKGSSQYLNQEMNTIFGHIESASMQTGIKNTVMTKLTGKSSAQRELEGLYNKYLEARLKGDIAKAEEIYLGEYRKGEQGIVDFLKSGEGEVFQEFQKLASASKDGWKDATSREKLRNSDVAYKELVSAARIFRNNIQPEVQRQIGEGIDALVGSLKRAGKIYIDAGFATADRYNNMVRNAEKIKERMESREMKDGFFPVLSLDVLPSLAEVSKKMHLAKNKEAFVESDNILNKLNDILDNNVYFQDSKKRTAHANQRVNMNIIPILDSYIRSGTRFKFVSENTANYIDALRNIHQISKESRFGENELNEAIQGMKSYLSDTYSAQVGLNRDPNSLSTKITRGFTAFEFMSKLGLNFRGALRNATQSALHWVWYGKKGLDFTAKELQNENMRARVDAGLKNNGIKFAEIEEIPGGFSSMYDFVELNPVTGAYSRKVNAGTVAAITEGMTKIAEKTGKPMQWVENRINRRWAYELGFTHAWKLDTQRIDYVKDRFERFHGKKKIAEMEKEPGILFGKESNQYEVRFEKYRTDRANKVAKRVVKDFHFDYSQASKAPIMQTKVGSVLFQFQHYGLNFFNFQRKLIRDGGRDVMSGQFQSDAVMRVARMGMLYSVINGIFAPLLNADFGNILQNDTYERLKNYRDAMFGDDEEQERAWFGKGPLVGQLGGPLVGDAITAANLSGFFDFDEDTWFSYLSGISNDADMSGSEKFQEIVRLLNIQIHRLFYQFLPNMTNGYSLGGAIWSGLGLQGNENTRKGRERLAPVLRPLGINLKNKGKEIAPAQQMVINPQVEQSLRALESLNQSRDERFGV